MVRPPAFFNYKNMRKIYEAPNTIISEINVIYNGKLFKFNFEPISAFAGSMTGRGSMYITSDPERQAALESSPYFHSEVFIYKEEEDKAEDNVEEKKEYTTVSVNSPSDARDYLNTNFNIDKKRIVNLKQIKSAAEKVGVIFEGI